MSPLEGPLTARLTVLQAAIRSCDHSNETRPLETFREGLPKFEVMSLKTTW